MAIQYSHPCHAVGNRTTSGWTAWPDPSYVGTLSWTSAVSGIGEFDVSTNEASISGVACASGTSPPHAAVNTAAGKYKYNCRYSLTRALPERGDRT